MTPKRITIFVLIILALCVFLNIKYSVNAQDYALSMTVNCPTKAYVGESFFCQVAIHNADNVSHSYLLLWKVDNSLNTTATFQTSGTLAPNETIDTGASFTFSNARDPYLSYIMGYNDHQIGITLMQDDQTIVATEYHDVKAVLVDISLVHKLQPIPVSPNSSFSLDLSVLNEGDEAVNASIKVYEVPNKIQLQSGPVANFSQISPRSLKNQTFNFAVTFDTLPGEYPIKVAVDYKDTRGNLYSRNYYVLVPISSGGVAERLTLLEQKEENDINKLRSDLDLTYRSVIMIGAALLVVNVGLALANYWHSRRIVRIRRKTAAKETKT